MNLRFIAASDNETVSVLEASRPIAHISVPTDGHVRACDVHISKDYPTRLKEHIVYAFHGALVRDFIRRKEVA